MGRGRGASVLRPRPKRKVAMQLDDNIIKADPVKIYAVCNCRETLLPPDEDGYVTGPDWCAECHSAVERIAKTQEMNKRV